MHCVRLLSVSELYVQYALQYSVGTLNPTYDHIYRFHSGSEHSCTASNVVIAILVIAVCIPSSILLKMKLSTIIQWCRRRNQSHASARTGILSIHREWYMLKVILLQGISVLESHISLRSECWMFLVLILGWRADMPRIINVSTYYSIQVKISNSPLLHPKIWKLCPNLRSINIDIVCDLQSWTEK
jgi:hypothetical protein